MLAKAEQGSACLAGSSGGGQVCWTSPPAPSSSPLQHSTGQDRPARSGCCDGETACMLSVAALPAHACTHVGLPPTNASPLRPLRAPRPAPPHPSPPRPHLWRRCGQAWRPDVSAPAPARLPALLLRESSGRSAARRRSRHSVCRRRRPPLSGRRRGRGSSAPRLRGRAGGEGRAQGRIAGVTAGHMAGAPATGGSTHSDQRRRG